MKIEPGTQLDQAVAEAVDPQCSARIRGIVVWKWGGERNWQTAPPPFSTDLNAAFDAAERIGLFDRPHPDEMVSLTKDEGLWHVQCCEWHTTAHTPALAVCAAILKLRELYLE